MSIYKIVNDIDDKIYIGSTGDPLETRFAGHKYASREGNTVLYNHMRKIGTDHFRIELVRSMPWLKRHQLFHWETYYIRLLGSYCTNEKGLNSTYPISLGDYMMFTDQIKEKYDEFQERRRWNSLTAKQQYDELRLELNSRFMSLVSARKHDAQYYDKNYRHEEDSPAKEAVMKRLERREVEVFKIMWVKCHFDKIIVPLVEQGYSFIKIRDLFVHNLNDLFNITNARFLKPIKVFKKNPHLMQYIKVH